LRREAIETNANLEELKVYIQTNQNNSRPLLINQSFLEMLRCPEDGSTLTEADAALVELVNLAIAAGRLRSVGGNLLQRPLDGGLVRAAGDRLYPILDQIPVMLPDEAIDLAELLSEAPQ
jgi:uncharacterized protein YbaR (Trm112 family)